MLGSRQKLKGPRGFQWRDEYQKQAEYQNIQNKIGLNNKNRHWKLKEFLLGGLWKILEGTRSCEKEKVQGDRNKCQGAKLACGGTTSNLS